MSDDLVKPWPVTETQTAINGVPVVCRTYARLENRDDKDVSFAYVSCVSGRGPEDMAAAYRRGSDKARFAERTAVLPPEIGQWTMAIAGLSDVGIAIQQGGGWSDDALYVRMVSVIVKSGESGRTKYGPFMLDVGFTAEQIEVCLSDEQDEDGRVLRIREELPFGKDVKQWAASASIRLKLARKMVDEIAAMGVRVRTDD